ncbi:MAG: hypothetical protein KJN98_04435, partial [Pontiella sp.]|nr:hypothetical protein [Pontiella sp.]
GISRPEFEYPIPESDAVELLKLCSHVVEKARYHIPYGSLLWELDVFSGDNEGLILAEVELESEEQAVDLPVWIGAEVTGDVRYYNAYLASHPFRGWEAH